MLLQFFRPHVIEAMVVISFLVVIAATLLRWAAVSKFHRERFPNHDFISLHHKLSWMTWSEQREYRRDLTSYFRRKGTLTYNRMLTVALVIGALGFVVFGYLAKQPKQGQDVGWVERRR